MGESGAAAGGALVTAFQKVSVTRELSRFHFTGGGQRDICQSGKARAGGVPQQKGKEAYGLMSLIF